MVSLFFIFITCNILSQEVVLLSSGPKISFRGISIAKNSIWVSGSGGTVGKSLDYGKTWEWYIIPGQEKNKFRDIEALDDTTAVTMGIGSPGLIYKTTNGGKNWTMVYQNNSPSIFMDAMAFENKKSGIVIGDPINGKFFVAETLDGGNTWKETEKLHLPAAITGEAFFAASGTNIVYAESKYYIVSGGMVSRIFFNKKATILPTMKGQQMTGANGLAIQRKNIFVASGNYNNLGNTDSALVYSKDGGSTWHLPTTPTGGYRSCVCFVGKNKAITVGLTGIDITYDAGKNWKKISKEGFNTCIYNNVENAVYFAGNNGRVGKLFF